MSQPSDRQSRECDCQGKRKAAESADEQAQRRLSYKFRKARKRAIESEEETSSR